MDTIYCTSCGTANKPGARFCFKCGAPIEVIESPAPVQPKSDFITLSCPNCGGKLDITPDMERFACKYCGNEHLVRRSGGAVSLAPVVEGLKRVEAKVDQALTGSDRSAAEQTIQRLKTEILVIEKDITEKEKAIKRPAPKKWLRTLALLIGISGIFVSAYHIGNLFGDTLHSISVWGQYWQYPSYRAGVVKEIYWDAIPHLFPALCYSAITIVAWIIEKANSPKSARKLERVKEELDTARIELQKRKEQLAQLHQYTAER